MPPTACLLRANCASDTKSAAPPGARDSPMIGRQHSRSFAGTLLPIVALAWLLPVPATRAEDSPTLGIQLNKLEDSAEGCRSVFVFDNHTGHELNRFRVDLILFDPNGVYSKQLLLDMAPLPDDKKTVTSFLLDGQPCNELGSVLVNDVPWCENGSGTAIDCVKMLKVGSLAQVPLQK
jgi:hypothetical protein